ncbi:THUMP domain-containing protein [Candidatus Binatia bacterium]|nr:THUMP domain-containing protein [Candidatus Binatia bacterium]
MPAARHDFFATTSRGLEPVAAIELGALGAEDVTAVRAGVAFSGPLEVAYRACLWSRVVNRVLLPVAAVPAATPTELYLGVRTVHWSEHLGPRQTLAVDCAAADAGAANTHYLALKTKDAIVDQLRERTGQRPSVDVTRPDVRVNVYVQRARAVVSIDLSGDSLHRRTYRVRGVAAPLKETLAAGVLLLADWPRLAATGAPLIDPMCGSGTLPIEAGLIAADVAPGLRRERFGFLGWRAHRHDVWERLLNEARQREVRDPLRLPDIRGYDVHPAAVRAALANVERAGLRGRVHIEKRALADCTPLSGTRAGGGVLVINPPYGERLGASAALAALYAEIGDVLRRRFPGWTGYVLTGSPELAKRIGLRATRRTVLYNGAIECRLLQFPIATTPVQSERGPGWRRVRG